MKSPLIRLLTLDDASRLLHFEQNNRAWFESQIEARPNDFYTIDGVHQHIAELLAAYAAGRAYPCLLVSEEGEILGRANLKNIQQSEGDAEVGYRIGYLHVGKGMATAALDQLITSARQTWRLQQLHAYVTDDNFASSRVLQKAGFKSDEVVLRLAKINQRELNGKRYTLVLN
jgi:ribosomal-protein-alanine N-acetyltransferase